MFTPLQKTDTPFWESIFTMPFKTARGTRIQTCKYRLIHRILPCNERLFKFTVKPSSTYELCIDSDSLIHFLFINCEKIKGFWDSWAIWWLNLTGYNILDDEFLIECLLFGFPGNSNNARIINFCTLYIKYFIYTHIIKGNNNFEFLGYLTYLKHVLMIEEKNLDHKTPRKILCHP